MSINQLRNLRRDQSGVVILEGLVAVFIFTIGILGLVGMLAASLKNVSEAQYRTDAAFHADSLLAQLRVADPGTRAIDFASPSGTSFVTWKGRITSGENALPGSSKTALLPTVVFTGANSRTVTVTIQWQAQNDTNVRNYIVETALE
ncbi:MAG: hypothetical protein PHV02_11600 [Rhodocyclaceae bacterium]|nr:hypothetical protein [Rhodocyclaceae bacterium]